MSPTQSSAPRKWILVVDDDADLRQLWVEALELEGYAAVSSQDGLAAAELIRDLFPDLIILDLRMPRMSGWDFLEVIGSSPRWQRIPVIIVSGHLDDEPTVSAKNVNIVGNMAKPVRLQEMLVKVREVVGPARPRRGHDRSR